MYYIDMNPNPWEARIRKSPPFGSGQPHPWEIQQPNIWPTGQSALGTTYIASTTPVKVEPKFKVSGPGYSLKLALLGYERESVSVKLVNGDLAIMASGGGLELDENVSHTVKVPKDASLDFDVTLSNGVLTITTELKPVEEVVLTIR
jgi:HSP20 family molecular chaperone IbpA